jgi:hypothetical protein
MRFSAPLEDPTPSISWDWRRAEGAADSWPEEAPARGAGAADSLGRTIASTAARERIFPPIVHSDLREARAASASAAAESGKALEAAVEEEGCRLGAGGSSPSSTAAATSAANGVPPADSTGDDSSTPGMAQSGGGADGWAAADGRDGA